MEQSEVLNSWKEISNYIGRGVRTVQRWEKDFGLPVRRPSGHLKGSVFALRHELDEWAAKCDARAKQDGPVLAVADDPRFAILHKRADMLKEKCQSLEANARKLRDHLQKTKALRAKLRERTMLTEMSST